MKPMNASSSRPMETAGFWRRLFAFLLDALLLGILGGLMGLIAFDRLVALGDWGRAVGLLVSLVYFGLMDSKLSGGQSVGKRALGIRVVTAGETPLSVGAASLRAAIFCIPYFLNGAFASQNAVISWLLVLLIFGVGLSIGYLLIFNRRTRQSLHDLAVGAYVVNDRAHDSVGTMEPIWPGHFGVVGVILALALVLPYFTGRLANAAPFAGLLAAQQQLQKEPGVRHAAVLVGVNRSFRSNHGAATTHTLSATLLLAAPVTSYDSLADRAVQDIMNSDPSAAKEDEIAVTIVYGYDIGITWARRSQTFARSPEQWRQRIAVLPTRL